LYRSVKRRSKTAATKDREQGQKKKKSKIGRKGQTPNEEISGRYHREKTSYKDKSREVRGIGGARKSYFPGNLSDNATETAIKWDQIFQYDSHILNPKAVGMRRYLTSRPVLPAASVKSDYTEKNSKESSRNQRHPGDALWTTVKTKTRKCTVWKSGRGKDLPKISPSGKKRRTKNRAQRTRERGRRAAKYHPDIALERRPRN